MSLKKYIVGGWVRDKLLSELGHPMQSNDKDWVVTGATPEEMLKLKFVPAVIFRCFCIRGHTKNMPLRGLNEKADTGIKALLFLLTLPSRWSRISCGETSPSMRWPWQKTDALSTLTAVLKT